MPIIPVIITTLDGLLDAVQQSPPVIYIDLCLFSQHREEIHTLLSQRTYHRFKGGKHGVFYFRAGIEEISFFDPLDIL